MKLPLPHNLYTRLTLSHFLVAIISIGAISIFAGRSIITASKEQVEHHLEDLAFAASNALEDPMAELLEGDISYAEVHNAIDRLLIDKKDILYTLYFADGTPLFKSDGSLPHQADENTAPEVLVALQNELGEGEFIRENEEGLDTLYVAVRIQHENEIFGVLRLETPLALAMTFTSQQRLLNLLLLSVVLVTLGVSVFGWLLARNLARPIEKLTTISERLRRGDLTARVTPTGPQELHLLAETFNSMANRVEGHMAELRAFVANASHELRTPLTSVKLRVEALRAGALHDPEVSERFLTEIEHEIDRLGKMVNDLLDLSRLEAGMESNQRDQVDIRVLIEEVCAAFTVRAERKNVNLNISTDSYMPKILGNEEQLRRVLTNLLDNALKHTPQGGDVNTEMQFMKADGIIYISVTDTGRGIAEKHLPHIFERFYRVEATLPRVNRLPGSGLGLAIAKSIVELHNGEISVTSEMFKGATFHIRLPVV
jgi:signal transduction histidine kinase